MSARPTAPPSAWRRRPFRSAVTALVTTSVVALGSIVAAPAAFAAESTVNDAVFTWGLNNEAGNSAYDGSFNLLSAGALGKADAGAKVSQSQWLQSEGNVSIEKKQPGGNWAASTWAGLNTSVSGGTIKPPTSAAYSENRVNIANGTGTGDVEDGTAEIQWTGTFTAAYYQGLTQFWVQNPKLIVDADGTGTVTATLGGYGTSMDNPDLFETLPPQSDVVIAALSGVEVTDSGFTVTPDYLGTTVTIPETGTPQSTAGANWGSFPQGFVDFQQLSGAASYWYSSGGGTDGAKPATPLGVSYTVAPVVPEIVPASITTQPVAVSATDGDEVTLSVAAAGDGPLSYLWQRSTDGATWTDTAYTTATATFVAALADNGAHYRVVVDNAAATPVTSDAVVLKVIPQRGETTTISNASLEWSYSRYAQYGIFGAWSQSASGANVALVTRDGQAVSGVDADAGKTFTLANFTGGVGEVDLATGAGQISWDTGDWVLNAYQGQFGAPDETFRDPILTTATDGTGTLSFEVFIPAAKDMSGNDVAAVGPKRIDIATFSSVSVVDGVLVAVPDYAGRDYLVDGVAKNVTCETPGVSGSWPSEYIDFVPSSVRAHYYTSSCSGLNLMKPPAAFTAEFQPVVKVAPAITLQPTDVVAPVTPASGSPIASFTVAATGSPAPTIAWERRVTGGEWTAIAGATSTTLALPYAAGDDATEVRAVVTNVAGTVTSDAATLTVGNPASITTQPVAASVKVGESATFTVGFTGDDAAVQWQRLAAGANSWTNVSGATGASLEVVTAAGDAGAQYRAIVTGSVPNEVAGSVFSATSAPASLTVDTTVPVAAAIVSQPASVVAPFGSSTPTVAFSVGVTGSPAPTVQWFSKSVDGEWTAITGATSTTLSYQYVSPDAGKQFRAVVTNGIGNPVTSDAATLTLGVPVGFGAQPSSVSVAHGEDAVFSVIAGGTPVVTLQWQLLALGASEWVDIDGATGDELTIPAADVRNGEQVRVVIANDIPTVPGGTEGSQLISDTASITLTAPGTVPAAPDSAALAAAPQLDLVGTNGDDITVSVGTEYAGQYVGGYVFSEPQWLGWALVAADGTVTFTVPSDLEAGDHTLAILDADGNVIGKAAFTVTVSVVTNPDGTTTTTTVLASTGADTAVPFLAGGLLLVAGLALALLARRRKPLVTMV